MKVIGGEPPFSELKEPDFGDLIYLLNNIVYHLEDKPLRDKAMLDNIIETIDQRVEQFREDYSGLMTEHVQKQGFFTHGESIETIGLEKVDNFRPGTISEHINFTNASAYATVGHSKAAVQNYVESQSTGPYQLQGDLQFSSNYVADEYPRATKYNLTNRLLGTNDLVQVGINKGQVVVFPTQIGEDTTKSLFVSNPIRDKKLRFESIPVSLSSYVPSKEHSYTGWNQPFLNVGPKKYLLFNKTNNKIALNYNGVINALVPVTHIPLSNNKPVYLIGKLTTNGTKFTITLDRIELMENTGDEPDEFISKQYYNSHLVSFENPNASNYSAGNTNKALITGREFDINTITGLTGNTEIVSGSLTLIDSVVNGKQVLKLVTGLIIKASNNSYHSFVMTETIEYLTISGIGFRYRVLGPAKSTNLLNKRITNMSCKAISNPYYLDVAAGHKGIFLNGKVIKYANSKEALISKEYQTNYSSLADFLASNTGNVKYIESTTRVYPYPSRNTFTSLPYRIFPVNITGNRVKYYVYGIDRRLGYPRDHILEFSNGVINGSGYRKSVEVASGSSYTVPNAISIRTTVNGNSGISLNALIFDRSNEYIGLESVSFNNSNNRLTLGNKVVLSKGSYNLLDTVFYTTNKSYLVFALSSTQMLAMVREKENSSTLKLAVFGYTIRNVDNVIVNREVVLTRGSFTKVVNVTNIGTANYLNNLSSMTGDQVRLSNLDIQITSLDNNRTQFTFNGYGTSSLGVNISKLSFVINNIYSNTLTVSNVVAGISNNFNNNPSIFPSLDLPEVNKEARLPFTIPNVGVRDLGENRVDNSNITNMGILPTGLEVVLMGRTFRLTEDYHFFINSVDKYVYLEIDRVTKLLKVTSNSYLREPSYDRVLLGEYLQEGGVKYLKLVDKDITFKEWQLSGLRRGSTIPVLDDVCGDGVNNFFKEVDSYKLPVYTTNNLTYSFIAAGVDGPRSYELTNLILPTTTDTDYPPRLRELRIGNTRINIPLTGSIRYTHPVTKSTLDVTSNGKITLVGGPHYKGKFFGSDKLFYSVGSYAHGELIEALGEIDVTLLEPAVGNAKDYDFILNSYSTIKQTLGLPISPYVEPIVITSIVVNGAEIFPVNGTITYRVNQSGSSYDALITVDTRAGTLEVKDNGFEDGVLTIIYKYGYENYNLNAKSNKVTFTVPDDMIISFII